MDSDSEQAFQRLQASLAAALDESLARHSQAALKGNLKTLDTETDLQRKLLGARSQLEALRATWPLPLGEHRASDGPTSVKPKRKRSSRPQKLKRGQKTPDGAYVLPILQALDEMGGRGATAKVVDRVGEIIRGHLNEYDRAKLQSGDIRWRNTAEWARNEMKEQGLVAADSPFGIWEITEQGRAYLREQRK